MSNTSDKLNAILSERTDLRETIVHQQNAMRKTLFTFVTILLGVVTIKTDNTLFPAVFPDPKTRLTVLFYISQIEIFLGFFVISQFTVQTATSGYIRVLESKINQLLGETVSVYESEVVPHFISHARGSHFWSMLIVIILSFAFFFYFLWSSFYEINNFLYGCIITIECICIVFLTIMAILDINRVEKYVRRFFKKTLKKEE